MANISTAGKLLTDLNRDNDRLCGTVAVAAGITAERAAAVMRGDARLSLLEQLRLSEAAIVLAPSVRRRALSLGAQVRAARGFEAGDVHCHSEPRVEPWERSAQLRR